MSDLSVNTLGGTFGSGRTDQYSSAALQNLDKNTFLELLVAQMRYQNPMNPADSNQFLAQAAQYASVEQLENMAKAQEDLKSMQMISMATSLVGRTVTATSDLTGEQISGVVETVRFGEEPILVVDGADVPLSSVTQVEAATTPESSPALTTSRTLPPTPVVVQSGTTTPVVPSLPAPVDTTPIETVPVDTAATEPAPTDTPPVDTPPVDTPPADAVPADAVPVDAVPSDTVPVDVTDPAVQVAAATVTPPATEPSTSTPAAIEQSMAAYQATQVMG